MAQLNVLLLISVQLFAVAFLSVSSEGLKCEVDGKMYDEKDTFTSGINGCAQCICDNGRASCDLTVCQTNANLSVAKVKNTLKSSNVNDDLNTIKNAIIKRANGKIAAYAEFNVIFNKLYEQRFNNRAEKLNKIVIYSSDSYVINNSSLDQKMTTIERSMSVTKTETRSITKMSGVSFSVGVSAFGFSMEAGYDTSESNTKTNSKTETATLKAPSQDVIVPPKSQIKVTFNMYEYLDINNYYLDFVVDDKSSLGSSSITFKKLMEPYHDILPIGEEGHLQLDYVNDKFVVRNFPAQSKLASYGIDSLINPEEAI